MSESTTDEEGRMERGKGKIREDWGKATGDTSEEIKGKMEQGKGKVKEKVGEAKEKM